MAAPTDWRESAACLEEDSDLFFPKGYEGPWQLVIEQAKAVCRRCPVADSCLEFADTIGASDGIFGGLTEKERASVRRAAVRHDLSPEAVTARTEEAREPRPLRRERTLHTILEDGSVRLHGGHLGWRGADKVTFQGRSYTPKQMAFIADRGRQPDGRVLASCNISDCILAAHIKDQAERGCCGTRSGYQHHRRNGEEACGPCRRANTDADNRLRRTGTTKAKAVAS